VGSPEDEKECGTTALRESHVKAFEEEDVHASCVRLLEEASAASERANESFRLEEGENGDT